MDGHFVSPSEPCLYLRGRGLGCKPLPALLTPTGFQIPIPTTPPKQNTEWACEERSGRHDLKYRWLCSPYSHIFSPAASSPVSLVAQKWTLKAFALHCSHCNFQALLHSFHHSPSYPAPVSIVQHEGHGFSPAGRGHFGHLAFECSRQCCCHPRR